MTQTITRLYDSYAQAERAIQALRNAGLTDEQCSIVGNRRHELETATDAGAGAAAGAGIGTAVG
eukprot:gene58886-80644_t